MTRQGLNVPKCYRVLDKINRYPIYTHTYIFIVQKCQMITLSCTVHTDMGSRYNLIPNLKNLQSSQILPNAKRKCTFSFFYFKIFSQAQLLCCVLAGYNMANFVRTAVHAYKNLKLVTFERQKKKFGLGRIAINNG